jgi:uncharacterized membrane protein
MSEFKKVPWRINTPNLFKEIINNNPEMWIMEQPLKILLSKLLHIAKLANDKQDKEIMKICCELALYAECDEESGKYNQDMVDSLNEKDLK